MTRSRSALAVSVALLAAVFLATPPAVADDRAAARRQFNRSQRLFAAGHYDQALAALAAAYEAAPLPGFLYNIGLCHQKLEHWPEARDYLQRYLQEVPDAPNRADVEALIEQVSAQIPPEPVAEPEPEPLPPEPEPPAVEPEPEPRPAPPPEGGGIGALTWITMIGGVALAGTTVFFSLRLSSTQADYDDLDCARAGDRCRSLRDDGEAAALYRNIFGAASAAVLVTATVLLIVDLTSHPDREDDEDTDEDDLQLSLGPGGAMARWSW